MTCGAHSWLHSWGIFERVRLKQCWIPVKNKRNSKEPKSVLWRVTEEARAAVLTGGSYLQGSQEQKSARNVLPREL